MNQSTTLRDSNSVHLVQLVCSVTIVKNFKSAEEDVPTVLSSDLSGDPGLRTKALYRRALARKNLAGPGQLEAALADLDLLVALEPGNREAAAEMARVETLLRADHSTGGGGEGGGKKFVAPAISVQQRKSVSFATSPPAVPPSPSPSPSPSSPFISSLF